MYHCTRLPWKTVLRAWFMAAWCGVFLEVLGASATAAIRVWDGGALTNANWTFAANWDVRIKFAPSPGDNLTFPAGAAQLVNTNSYTAGTGFGLITWSGAGYSAYGNTLVVSNGINVTHGAGTTTAYLPITLGDYQTFNVNNSSATFAVRGGLNLDRYSVTFG